MFTDLREIGIKPICAGASRPTRRRQNFLEPRVTQCALLAQIEKVELRLLGARICTEADFEHGRWRYRVQGKRCTVNRDLSDT